MMFTLSKQFEEAFTQAAKVLNNIKANTNKDADSYILLSDISAAIRQMRGIDVISVSTGNLKEMMSKPLKKFITKNGDCSFVKAATTIIAYKESDPSHPQHVNICVNNQMPTIMQRFAFAHEVGHLLLSDLSKGYFAGSKDKAIISAYVDPDITAVQERIEKDYTEKEYEYMLAEQACNIFALLTLIPKDLHLSDLEGGMVTALADKYGVTETAVYTRMFLSSVKLA